MGTSHCSKAEHWTVVFLMALGQPKDPLDDKASFVSWGAGEGPEWWPDLQGEAFRRQDVTSECQWGICANEKNQNVPVSANVRNVGVHV